MDSQRNFFLIALLFITFVIWQVWQTDNLVKIQKNKNIKKIDNVAVNTTDNIINQDISTINNGKTITITTDVISLTINTCGGDIVQAKLLSYKDKLGSNNPFTLLTTTPGFIYQAQSRLVTNNINDKTCPLFITKQNNFVLSKDKTELYVPMTYFDKNGIEYTKTFLLKRGDFAINVNYDINNTTNQAIKVMFNGQLKQTINLPVEYTNNKNNFTLQSTFRGAVFSTHDKKYKKYEFSSIGKNSNLNAITDNGWIAMVQQYFTTAWIPKTNGKNLFYISDSTNNGIATIGYRSASITIPSGAKDHLNATLWIGPAIQEKMARVATYLDLTVDYGWLWFISQPLLKLLKFLNTFICNWGISIIVITLIIRGIMYPLTKSQYISMAKMRMLQPKIQEIRERLANNKEQQSKEMLELYKTEKVNPLGGCLPVIIQMPIFLALYYMLMSSIELRHAPFALWIKDLSAQDPYYILPIVMGITMFCIQKMSSNTTSDSVQNKIMTYIPLIFTIFFLWFPSGLVLYYIASNLITIIQQRIIYKSLEKHGLHS